MRMMYLKVAFNALVTLAKERIFFTLTAYAVQFTSGRQLIRSAIFNEASKLYTFQISMKVI